jgi:peptidoglycan/xylan/chitin deacetylase (PgdA/CDA1 family)
VWWALGVLGALAVLAALAWFVVPYPVSVDGTTRWVTLGTTLGQMEQRRLVSSKPGDLVSVKGKVLKIGGGTPVVMYVDGKVVDPASPVWPGSTVKTVGGDSAVEATVTQMVKLALPVDRPGRGPVLFMTSVGTPGMRKVIKGAQSGEVVRSEIVSAPVPSVVLRTRPLNTGRVIALTFDDGPQRGSTPAILAILRQYKAKATFFMVGREASKQPAIARQVRAEGHTIGNHSLSHQGLLHAGKKWAESQILGGASAIRTATGVWPKWYRPAGGSYNDTVLEVARSAHEHLVMWNIDPDDWQNPSVVNLVNRVVASAKPGAIILMHDGGGNRADTIAALPQILTRLSAAGYTFVTMDQLYSPAPAPAPKPAPKPAPASPAPVKKP